MSSRPQWQETSDAESDSSEQRLAMVDALEEMAQEAEARDNALIDSDFEEDEDDEDYEDAEDDEDEDEDDIDFDVEDMEGVVGDVEVEGIEIDDDDDDDDEDEDEDDEEDEARIELQGGDGDDEGEDRVTFTVQELLQRVLAPRSTGDDTTPGAGESRTARAIQGIGIAGLRQLLAQGGFRLRTTGGDDDDDEDDDDDDGANWYGTTRHTGMADFWEPIKSPLPAGQELLLSGDFGRTPKRPVDSPAESAFDPGRNVADRISKRRTALNRIPKDEMDDLLPNSSGTEVARYPARVYCGQYSQDSSFFYTCTQDFRVQMYDTTAANSRRTLRMDEGRAGPRRSQYYTSFGTTQYTSLKPIKTIQGRMGSWTITDANLSPDNQWMIYSSITPVVHLVSTRAESQGGQDFSDRQVPLDFGAAADDGGGIWSIRFSGDSREIVAGAHFGDIYVYDIEARRRVLRVEGHRDDVNGVAFADSASSNVLISGSDDSFVKVWDRRSLSGGKPAGVLPGHTEGITYVSPKGDGRYCISNGKDQSLKLWDLRSMHSSSTTPGERTDPSKSNRSYGLSNWDYRNMYYRKPRYQSHPEDCSVMTYRGHAVLKTLIRCHFSPEATTGQKYVYSGSADGRIHIWGLDGRVVRVLDRSKAKSIFCGDEGEQQNAADPSAPEWDRDDDDDNNNEGAGAGATPGDGIGGGYSRSHAYGASRRGGSGSYAVTVRDVAWHSSESSIMSTAWDGSDGQRGSVAKHEWKGYGKGTSLEDAFAREEAEMEEGRAL